MTLPLAISRTQLCGAPVFLLTSGRAVVPLPDSNLVMSKILSSSVNIEEAAFWMTATHSICLVSSSRIKFTHLDRIHFGILQALRHTLNSSHRSPNFMAQVALEEMSSLNCLKPPKIGTWSRRFVFPLQLALSSALSELIPENWHKSSLVVLGKLEGYLPEIPSRERGKQDT